MSASLEEEAISCTEASLELSEAVVVDLELGLVERPLLLGRLVERLLAVYSRSVVVVVGLPVAASCNRRTGAVLCTGTGRRTAVRIGKAVVVAVVVVAVSQCTAVPR